MEKKVKGKLGAIKLLSIFSVKAAIFLIVAGMFLGTALVFRMSYWSEIITRDEATSVTATYESFEVNKENEIKIRNMGATRGIEVHFADQKSLAIDGSVASEDVSDALAALYGGERVYLLVHPSFDTIWEMRTDGNVIVSFDDVREDILCENIAFLILGVFMYFVGVVGIVALVHNLKERSKDGDNATADER